MKILILIIVQELVNQPMIGACNYYLREKNLNASKQITVPTV